MTAADAPNLGHEPMIPMAPRNATLSTTDWLAIDLLMTGGTQEEVARRLNIHRKTLWRRRQRPEFKRALYDAEEDQRRAQLRGVAIGARTAARYLLTVLTDDQKTVAERTRAASILLGRWVQLQPSELRAEVAMSMVEPVDTSDALDRLRGMLGGIAENRALTELPVRGSIAPSTNGRGGNSSNGDGDR